MQIPDSRPLMTQTEYAARRGVSKMAVSNAVKRGRLRASVVRDEAGKFLGISDPDLADREWASKSDYTDAPQRAQTPPAEVAPALVAVPAHYEPGRHVLVPDAEPGDESPDIASAAAKEKHWRAKLAELKFREAAGELVPVAQVAAKLVDVFSSSRTKLLGLPGRARQALPHLTLEDIAALEALVREALEDLAQTAVDP